jgi:hypothetical protein
MNFSDIARDNTTAVELMTIGKSMEAVDLLTQGVAFMKESSLAANLDKLGSGRTSFAVNDPAIHEIQLSSPVTEMDVSPDNPFRFFHIAFAVDPSIETVSSPDVFRQTVSSVALYNLALAHHQHGLSCGCSRDLRCALTFYRLAAKAVHCWCESSPVEAELLILTIMANMAQIHAHHFDLRQASICNKVVLGLLAGLEDDSSELLIEMLQQALFCRKLTTFAPAA